MGKFKPPSAKEIRATAHEIANLNRDQVGHMMAVAINGNQGVRGFSSPIGGVAGPNNPLPTYLIDYRNKLPWNGLTPVRSAAGAVRDFSTCAEAHVWLELMGRGKNPRSYTLVSFNGDNIIAAPCANCAQWVERAFGHVYKETPAYEGRTRQRP